MKRPLETFPGDDTCAFALENVADAVFAVDRDFIVRYCNLAAGEIARTDPAEAVGRTCREVFGVTNCRTVCVLRQCMEEARPIANRIVTLKRANCPDVPVCVSVAPIWATGGTVVGGVQVFRDLSGGGFVSRLAGLQPLDDFGTRDAHLSEIVRMLPQIAQSDSTVLLLGESGTGKEVFARAIHKLSQRGGGPFVAVNCGALPEQLMESELFGYKSGAFTDARKDKPGRFALADSGTLLLDEIGDLPYAMQAKILRALQERSYEPLGGVETVPADVRVIAATNRDLGRMVAEGKFRQDLYYRLSVVVIRIPPLRERPGDVPLLVERVLGRCRMAVTKTIESVSPEAMERLLAHDYPGNIRELENIIEYAAILCQGRVIEPCHLPEHLRGGASGRACARARTMAEIRFQAAREAVDRHSGNRNAACRELGISKDTLRRILGRRDEDA
ncbi:MAG: sigma 54-interacting transcriptional regulator [Solidesulfovibrio sp.]|uniref:sigma-54 interaction domain-containing protein n=1 Tax=Solidesulfovibrio sp. TaxID=2910990 RepID=UPI003158E0FC